MSVQVIDYINTLNKKVANRGVGDIKYLVIHYVGGLSTAEQNCKYLASRYTGTSAHYFVGHEGEIYRAVEDKDIAWHCGAKTYVHPSCRNANSIGVEMCVKKDANGVWYFEDVTVEKTIELVKELMIKYNLNAGSVIRHKDVTGKCCPEPYVRDISAWNLFKARLTQETTVSSNVAPVVGASTDGIHVVVKGETLYSISRANNITVAKIMELNGLTNTVLTVGQKLILSAQPTVVQPVVAHTPIQAVIIRTYKLDDHLIYSSIYPASTSSDPIIRSGNGYVVRVITTACRNPYGISSVKGGAIIGWCNDGDIRGYYTAPVSAPIPVVTVSSGYDEWVARLQTAIGGIKVDGFAGDITLSHTPTIERGDTGAIVKLVQERLTKLGFSTGGIDGVYGKAPYHGMYDAVIKYQKSFGGVADGVITSGKLTWKHLLNLA